MVHGVPNRLKTRSAAAAARPRFFLTFLVLLAFLLQSQIAQTHIHISTQQAGLFAARTVGAGAAAPVPKPDQAPQDDTNKCPLCQAAMALGAALGPNVFYVLQPALDGVVLAIRELAAPAVFQPAHVWHSRGPPQA